MKWKRSKKAQQEAKAKAAAERAAKLNGTPLPSSMNKTPENKSKRITEEDEALSSDPDDEDIDVGDEDQDSDSMNGNGSRHVSNLVATTPILGMDILYTYISIRVIDFKNISKCGIKLTLFKT